MSEERKMERIIRGKLDGYQAKPSSRVWERIDAQLPVPVAKRWIPIPVNIAVAACVFTGTLLWVPPPGETGTGIALREIRFEQTIVPPSAGAGSIADQHKAESSAGREARPEEAIAIRPIRHLSAAEPDIRLPASYELAAAEEEPAAPEITEKLISHNSIRRIDLETAVEKNLAEVSAGKRQHSRKSISGRYSVKGLHAGPAARLNSTWILNQNTHYQFRGYELAYKFDFGYEYGFRLGYDFSNRFGLQAEYIMTSAQGQKYEDIIWGELVSREVALTYVKLPLMIKYKLTQVSPLTRLPVSRNFILGAEYGRMTEAEEEVNGTRQTTTHLYDRNMIDLVFGMEFDFYVSRNVFLTLGGRGAISSDINGLRSNNYDSYRQSHNFLLGLSTGLSYVVR